MSFLTHGAIADLLSTYGYWLIAAMVAAESMGLPLPGETTLIAAAILAGTSPRFNIEWVIGAAAVGAVLGDNVGFLVGRHVGYRVLARYGPKIRLSERRLRLGQYLFSRHGGKVVFFGRFVALLRVLAALLAGANRMRWPRFAIANVCGGVLWAAAYGLAGWLFGQAIEAYRGPVAIGAGVLAVMAVAASWWYLRRHEHRLQEAADRAFVQTPEPPPKAIG